MVDRCLLGNSLSAEVNYYMTRETTDTAVSTPKTTTGLEFVVAGDEELERSYRVIIENDDVTPMDFVVMVLLTIFELEFDRAFEVMLEAHNTGHAYVVTLPFEEAQQRVYTAHSAASEAGYPLRFFLEPE
jgi:ATP-dependent Clp protease adaptor protein ClpS